MLPRSPLDSAFFGQCSSTSSALKLELPLGAKGPEGFWCAPSSSHRYGSKMLCRRKVIGGLGGLLAAQALPTKALAKPVAKPMKLRLGDTIGLIAPASSDD